MARQAVPVRSAILSNKSAHRETSTLMATQEDVRRIAMALPDSVEGEDRFSFGVLVKGKVKGYVWAWLERIDPKKARVPSSSVIAVRVSGEEEKQLLLASNTRVFFTEPHYNGYPAVLIRLVEIAVDELEELIKDAYLTVNPPPKQPRKRKADTAGG